MKKLIALLIIASTIFMSMPMVSANGLRPKRADMHNVAVIDIENDTITDTKPEPDKTGTESENREERPQEEEHRTMIAPVNVTTTDSDDSDYDEHGKTDRVQIPPAEGSKNILPETADINTENTVDPDAA